MTLRESARRLEIGLGLGMAACLLWTLLEAVGMAALLRLGLSPGTLAVALVTGIRLLSLWLSVGLASLLLGVMLVSARPALGVAIVGVAVGFRAAVYFLAGTLDPPWRSLPEGLLLALGVLISVGWSFWMIRLGGRWAARRAQGGGEPKPG
ncbi:MAG: hypothetical protein GYA21_11815 [Myxococcales bacterium]|nr:hypothetical protein [Myxococcales bacterium]